jgi:hypothetical protein
VFGILIVVSRAVVRAEFQAQAGPGRPDVQIDFVGVVLCGDGDHPHQFRLQQSQRMGHRAGAAVGALRHRRLSPAPAMIVVGIVLGQAFFLWTRRREAAGRTALLPLSVLESPQERAAVYAMFSVVALEAMLNFSVPLYIQIVQGRSALATAVAMLPFNLTVFFAAMFIVRFYDKLTPRKIGMIGFGLCATALLWLAFVVRNDWSSVPVMFGLVVFGIRPGVAGDVVVQRVGDVFTEGTRGRCRFAARHDQQPRRRRGHRGRRCIARGPV